MLQQTVEKDSFTFTQTADTNYSVKVSYAHNEGVTIDCFATRTQSRRQFHSLPFGGGRLEEFARTILECVDTLLERQQGSEASLSKLGISKPWSADAAFSERAEQLFSNGVLSTGAVSHLLHYALSDSAHIGPFEITLAQSSSSIMSTARGVGSKERLEALSQAHNKYDLRVSPDVSFPWKVSLNDLITLAVAIKNSVRANDELNQMLKRSGRSTFPAGVFEPYFHVVESARAVSLETADVADAHGLRSTSSGAAPMAEAKRDDGLTRFYIEKTLELLNEHGRSCLSDDDRQLLGISLRRFLASDLMGGVKAKAPETRQANGHGEIAFGHARDLLRVELSEVRTKFREFESVEQGARDALKALNDEQDALAREIKERDTIREQLSVARAARDEVLREITELRESLVSSREAMDVREGTLEAKTSLLQKRWQQIQRWVRETKALLGLERSGSVNSSEPEGGASSVAVSSGGAGDLIPSIAPNQIQSDRSEDNGSEVIADTASEGSMVSEDERVSVIPVVDAQPVEILPPAQSEGRAEAVTVAQQALADVVSDIPEESKVIPQQEELTVSHNAVTFDFSLFRGARIKELIMSNHSYTSDSANV
jgi:hypothetical protein